ncbi:dTDP-4-dehydrorhamnose reductase [Actinacidiphila bryophytorum]|uniref:dTDP-4-dehydrorhamnose reductase n=1 Tax=Actinacidiphila bryophytorum TaxID=1436133 RepID=A0A9W4EDG9_9ACTN|nr:dTDP-4-dehydrorhamnose reductase [Actinacidiphila bryophytorum]MBM9440422.1 dTDP-4-dehydrorhamnose reductase [Actinacidiphila bryophytorum]MBN6546705.1 dTDP-4-dehydrorhamnose reductase [Actinacidiphila bryophytorum]CAG7622815.1 putative dTDP-4-dehydrorhamnose reductase [Actinacidiphila bryophytorum]
MTWLVTGAGGMLARDLLLRLAERGEAAVGVDRAAMDVTDEDAVRAVLDDHRPSVVVNCAAWTAVDAAESAEGEALRVNGEGPRHLAVLAAKHGARLLHLSTDYVFAGDAAAPYRESDRPAPRTAYGRTKLAGEQAVLDLMPGDGYVVRTAWLYGAGGPNFVRTMIRLERERDTVDVVGDQYGQPTWTADLAEKLVALGTGGAPAGIYHGTSAGAASWYDLAREVFWLLGADPDRVRRVGTSAVPRPAPRPAYSVLGHGGWAAAGAEPIRDWRQALAAAFPALRNSS